MSVKNKSIIMIPYANNPLMRSGENVIDKKRFDIYMKNSCVALLSAKHYNAESDVALVTNIDVPDKYKSLLQKNDIIIINVEFDSFCFQDNYKWGLAFYKLCALKYVVENYDYDFISYLDADVYIQSNFENIWKECTQNILLYDINHGLQVRDYRLFLEDVNKFTKSDKIITHFGGEFFAANRENARIIVSDCLDIYYEMFNDGYYTDFGDEFILSLAADKNKEKIKNSAPYIFRFWTGDFRLVSTSYKFNPITIIHVPDEKNSGILKIYDYIVKHEKLPRLSKVHLILHLKHRKTKTLIKEIIKKLIKR